MAAETGGRNWRAGGDLPLVSVIIPTFNRAHCIERAIRSVLAQAYSSLELIVVDDASTDGTPDLVRTIDDPRIKLVVHEANCGAGAARNTGLAAAAGELIAFQDSDDEWMIDKLHRQIALLKEAPPDHGAVYGGKLLYGRNESGAYGTQRISYIPEVGRKHVSGDIAKSILQGNLISPQTLLVEREVVNKVGTFDTRLPCDVDWEFMICMSNVTKVVFSDEPVVLAFVSPDSISRSVPTRLRARALAKIVILRKLGSLFERDNIARSEFYFRIGRQLQRLHRHRSANRFFLRALSYNRRDLRFWAAFAANRLQSWRL